MLSSLVLTTLVLSSTNAQPDRIHLDNVTAITLRQGWQTKGRRSTVPQLDCRDPLCQEYAPKAVQCKQVGKSPTVQWKCEAEMTGVQFDQSSLVVSCEGYDYPDDEFITVDSCGLKYSLEKIKGTQTYSNYYKYQNPSWNVLMGNLCILMVVMIFIFACVGSCNDVHRPAPRRNYHHYYNNGYGYGHNYGFPFGFPFGGYNYGGGGWGRRRRGGYRHYGYQNHRGGGGYPQRRTGYASTTRR